MKKIYQDTTFYLIIFIVSYFIYIYPFEILNNLIFNEEIPIKTSLYYTLLVSALVILYFRVKINLFPLKFFVYEGMGVGFISFCIINITLIFSYLGNFDKFYLGIFAIILIIIFSFLSLVIAKFIFIKNIRIYSDNIKKNYNFIFISDIHLGSNSINHFKRILKKINTLDYDFILIGGDLIDSSSFEIKKLSILNKINKPIFFVTGNHEYYISRYKEKLSKLDNYNINYLKNDKFIFQDLNIIGVDDNIKNEQKIEIVKKLIDKSKFNIALLHKPSIWDEIKNNTNLMISGHTHNGQIFPFNFLVRIQFKYKYGLYKHNFSNLYVSSGSGCWGPKMRLGSFNEIVSVSISTN